MPEVVSDSGQITSAQDDDLVVPWAFTSTMFGRNVAPVEGPGGPTMSDGKQMVDARISNNHKCPC